MLPLRLAYRDLRGGLGGLRLLFVCLFLGVAALAAVGSLSGAIVGELSARGGELLGGDVEVRLSQREATPAERASFARLGTVSTLKRLRAMVRARDRQQLAELKAVDGRYPVYGAATTASGHSLQAALAQGLVLAPALAEQLGVRPGDSVQLGLATLPVADLLTAEPDRAGGGFGFGPTAMIALARLPATGLIQPGSLYATHYRLKLPPRANLPAAVAELRSAHPDAGWQVADRSDGAPGTRRFVENLGQFLILVGLTSLVVAGVGVGNGVGGYLDRKTGAIATLKSLGAPSRLIASVYLAEVALVALAAIACGLLAGALAPAAVASAAGDALPVPPALGLQWPALGVAAAYGLLTALAFALWPVAAAARVPAARLFRGQVERARRPGARTVGVIALAAAGVVALALFQSGDWRFAAGFLGGAAALVALLTLLAWAVRLAAARLPRPRGVIRRLALANLHRPGAPTRQLIVALGLGLTLFATLGFVETSLRAQLTTAVPARAPAYFVLDLPKESHDEFAALVRRTAPGAELHMVPSLRGPVTAINGVRVLAMKHIPDGAWILRGDRGLTTSATLPAGNTLTAGRWWPADYAGPPLVSVDADAAGLLGLHVGDHITVSVLGVDVTATVANLRHINWQSFGFNFALVFDPNSLAGAPFTYMATVAPRQARQEQAFARAAGAAFPTASLVRVKDVIGEATTLFGQMAAAVRWAAAVAILAGVAVLVGAIAAGARARTYDAVILKVLGATRVQLLGSALAEYGLIAATLALLSTGLGALAGWLVVTEVLQLAWWPDWPPVVGTVLAGAAAVVLMGLAGSWRALGRAPNAVLRAL